MSSRRRGDRHDWNYLDSHLEIHHAHLNRLREYFVIGDDLSYDPASEDTLVIRGRIKCDHSLFLDVLKIIEVEGSGANARCRTIKYSYHAGISGEHDRTIFRYDNADPKPGHEDAHHKHRFDPVTWEEILPEEWIGHEGWPHLNEVLEELHEWWLATGQSLDLSAE